MVSLPDKTKVPVRFADNFMSTDQDVRDLKAPRPETRWCLLELPQKDIDSLSKGSTFYFRSHKGGSGLNDGGVALSTDDTTFSIEFLENSNSLFLTQIYDDGQPQEDLVEDVSTTLRGEVFGQVRGHMLTKVSPVNERRIAELLSRQQVGTESEEPPVTSDVLHYEIGASSTELQAILNVGPYVEVNGAWKLLPKNVESDVLDTVVNVVAARGWKHEDVDSDMLFQEVRQHLGPSVMPSKNVLLKALQVLVADPMDDSDRESQKDKSEVTTPSKGKQPKRVPVVVETNERLKLDKTKMVRFQAMQLLAKSAKEVRERFNLTTPEPPAKRPRHGLSMVAAILRDSNGPGLTIDEFAAIHQEISGSAEKMSESDVRRFVGTEAYVDEFEGTLHLLDAASLPMDPVQRLARLFTLQSHWSPGRLSEQIEPCLGKGIKVEAWLQKHTRAVFIELVPGQETRLLMKKFAL